MGLFNMRRNKLSKFKRTYSLTDFGMTADVAVSANTWQVVGSVTVPAQQEVTFGSNDPIGGASVAGAPCYIRFDKEPGTQLQGKIRLSLSNANQTNVVDVMEESTQRLSASVSDRTQAVLLPEYPMRVGQDSLLLIKFYSATAVTIDYNGTNTSGSIPVTVYQ